MSDKNNKYENFVINRDDGISINAALFIIIPGFLGLWLTIANFTSVLLTPNIFIDFSNQAINGFLSNIELMGVAMFYVRFDIVLPSLLGWFIGGLFSAIYYGKEGTKSPIKSGVLVLKIFIPISIFALFSVIWNRTSLESYAIVENIGGSTLVIIALVLPLLAIPVVIMGSLGYRIGLIFSN